MKVRYVSEMRFPWPPGRDYFENDLELEELPPLAQLALERDGLDALLTGIYRSDILGAEHWWWVRPCAS